MTPWLQTPPRAQPAIASLASTLPLIETERLTLRAPRLSDWPVLEPIWTTDRATHIGGPMSVEEAWLDFNQIVASWVLRGHGGLTMCDKSGEVLGLVLVAHEFGDPQPELGWLLTENAEGKGYATEAAAALIPLARGIYGEDFVSYIADDNAASIRLATRLGGIRTGTHAEDAEVGVYHYPTHRSAQ